jgi:hypothetical protein
MQFLVVDFMYYMWNMALFFLVYMLATELAEWIQILLLTKAVYHVVLSLSIFCFPGRAEPWKYQDIIQMMGL